MINLNGKVVIVTGAAGNLGSAVVRSFLQAGAIVCGIDHREGRLEDQLGAAQGGKGTFHPFEAVDVTDQEQILKLSETIQTEFGVVDVVSNTVGGFATGERVDELSEETWDLMFNLNVMTVLNTAKAFIPGMINNGQGKFITIGSKAALKGGSKTGAYAAAKAAVLRLTESMAAELKDHNIQVNCILPGTIDTPENRRAMPNADFSMWVSPEKIAEVILFLASPAAEAVTGAAIPVYGRS